MQAYHTAANVGRTWGETRQTMQRLGDLGTRPWRQLILQRSPSALASFSNLAMTCGFQEAVVMCGRASHIRYADDGEVPVIDTATMDINDGR